MSDNDEVIELVDEHDMVIRTATRGEIDSQNLKYIRGTSALLVNAKGEIWVPIRSSRKSQWPGGFDFSMGEHVGVGESYEAAFHRGVREELGLDTASMPWRLLGHMTPPADGTNTFMAAYELQSDETPEFDASEFASGEWMRPQDLVNAIKAGHPYKPDLLPTVVKFYLT